MTNKLACKYCGSSNVVKYGTHEGIQRYWCKDCKRKFADNKALPEMKTPISHIASALSCYFGGMSLDAIQRHLQQQFGVYYSEMGIYNWVKRLIHTRYRVGNNRNRRIKRLNFSQWLSVSPYSCQCRRV